MILKKLIVATLISLTTNVLFAQPGLNVQNRINSKVQTRVPGNVDNSNYPKATVLPNSNKANQAERSVPKTAFVKPQENKSPDQNSFIRSGASNNENRSTKDKNAVEPKVGGGSRNRD